MNPAGIDEAIRELRHALPPEMLRGAVLFGSAARNEAAEDSDIDLLVLPRSRRATRQVLNAIQSVEKARKVKISPLISHSASLSDVDRQLLESIVRQGIPIVGALPDIGTHELELEPVRLLSLGLRGLDQRSKVRLERELFGYRSRRRYRRKVYSSRTRGRLELLGGRRIGRTLVIVPERAVGEVDRLLRCHGAHRVFVPAWIQRP